MVNRKQKRSIMDQSPPLVPGHQSTSGLQGSAGLAEQPGRTAVIPLEGPAKRKKWTRQENTEIMRCYFDSNPEIRGFQKRMFHIWKGRFPNTHINEQRLMDQRRYIIRNKIFTDLELRELEKKNDSTRNNIPEESNHAAVTPSVEIHNEENCEIIEQNNNECHLTLRQTELKDKIVEIMKNPNDRQRLPALKRTRKKELLNILKDVNPGLRTIKTKTLDETNQLIYSTAAVITSELGYRTTNPVQRTNTPKWKFRLEMKINRLRADISNLKNLKERKLKNGRIKERLEKIYSLRTKTIRVVTEELKQRVTAISRKIERYDARINQFRQNQQFRTNQNFFYKTLMEDTTDVETNSFPDKDEILKFWRNIWDNSVKHNNHAEWIKEYEKDAGVTKMEDMVITSEMVEKQAKKVKNWSAPGKDEVHGFWLKHLTSLHERLAMQFNQMLQTGAVENWMTTGRTFLIMKDKEKGGVASNYRPITCLPSMFKLFTGILARTMSTYFFNCSLYPPEQKGNCSNSRGTKDQLLIDKMILKNSKRRKTNLQMAWIDYKKAFDSLPHSWIQKCLEMLGISDNIRKFLKEAMKQWNTTLMVNGQEIGKVNIRRGIFQGDSLSPLLFTISMIPLTNILNKTKLGYELSKQSGKVSHLLYMDDLKLYGKSKNELESLLNTVRIYSEDIKMEFGFDKCAILTIKKGKIKQSEGTRFENGNVIMALPIEKSYKYLGISESDNILHSQIKKKTSSEYIKRVRKVLKSKLNGGNIIKAINTWAIPLIRYTAGIIDWTNMELDNLDRKTRKMMTLHHALHPRSDIDRLYLPRKIGGRGLLQIKQVVEEESRGLCDYIRASKERLLMEVCKANILKMSSTKEEYKNEQLKVRLENWKNKPLHGQYLKHTESKVDKLRNWKWLQIGAIKKETEGLIFAAQEQALQTNMMKSRIQHVSTNAKCRLCKEKDETVNHLISGCSKIAQTDYKQRHDRVATMVHWRLCKKYNFQVCPNWYNHKIEKVLENDEAKILWDFKLQTDRHLAHNTPDITVVEKKRVTFVDVAIPEDSRIEEKELEKITKYRDLSIEIGRLWKTSCKVIPVVVGALGSISKGLHKFLEDLQISDLPTSDLQKTALLGTCYILRRYLDNS